MPDKNVFFGEGEKGRGKERRDRNAKKAGRIMKCKNRDKKKMDRYTVEVK